MCPDRHIGCKGSDMNHTLTAALALLLVPGFATAKAVVATGHDSVTTPGNPVELEAKFEGGGWRFWRPDLKDRPATFRVGGLSIVARTDRDGVARATVRAPSPGVYPVEAALDEAADKVAHGRLFVLDPARPTAVVDIDGTLSSMNELLVPFFGHKAKAYPHSPELLRDLARTHQIVYLTARDDAFDAKSREFLTRHGFPDGPVLYNDLGLTSKAELAQLNKHNHGAFKLRVIQGLQARGVNVTIGIGNSETDAYAYEQAGLPSYIQTDKQGSGPSFRFQGYENLRPRLVADGFLSPGLAGVLAQ